jgi:GNAT superfamily N-acetyltransferase
MNLNIKHESDSLAGIVIWAHHQNEKIGYLWLTGEFSHANNARFVRNIEVVKKYQRQGVATQLWNYAETNGFNPTHDLVRTDEGKAWIEQLSEQTC